MRYCLLVLLTVLFSDFSYSQNKIHVSGQAKTYAGDRLQVNAVQDFITRKQELKSACTVDSSGFFNLSFEASQTALYAMPLGVFEGRFYARPGDTLHLVLPRKTLPDKQDSLNPFFRPEKYYLRNLYRIEEDITALIKAFEKAYNKEMRRLFADFSGRIASGKIDSAVHHIDSMFSGKKPRFFNDYVFYRYAALRHLAYQKDAADYLQDYFIDRPVLYNNPAYTEALDLAAGNRLSTREINALFRKRKNEDTRSKLNARLLEETKSDDEQLKEYILLINLFQAAFTQEADRNSFMDLFRQIIRQSPYPEHREISSRILKMLSGPANGSTAPEFSLKDSQGRFVELDDYKGKFVYLVFYSPDSYTGNKELALLQSLSQENLPNLKIAVIYKGHDFASFKSFVQDNNFSFDLLFAPADASVFDDYRVMRYPEYYLIHPGGKILLVAAPSPAKNFTPVYGSYYTEWHREQIRKKARENKALIKD